MNIAAIAKTRRTTKAFDPTRPIPADQIAQIEELLRFSPSSTNSQPWHFFIASTAEGKAMIARAASAPPYHTNAPKILNASHVVVLTAKNTVDDAHLAALLEQEAADGRLPTPQAKDAQNKGRTFYVNLHRFDRRDVQHWTEKQVYLALGTLLLGAATLGIDACPIEGFDHAILDQELDLQAKGLVSSVIVALGYSGADDFNATLPKSRLPLDQVLTRL